MNTQRLILDLDKSSVPRGRVTIAQCDHDGTTVEAEIYDNGIALSTSGLSAYLVMRLPDGRHYYRVPATLDGHMASALVDEAYAATATGTTEIAYFELVGSGGVVYSTSRFGVRVLPSATADATVPETWDGEVERLIQQLDDAIESATDAANVANAAAANADATADGVESRVQEMAQDAAETATADAEQRIQDAIDAMGDISELAVPLMSADVRGGARLEEHGGLILRDEKLGIGSLVQESDGLVRGGIAGLTAEGHAEQASTTGKNLLPITLASIKAANTSGTWSGNIYTFRTAVFTFETIGESITKIIVNGTALNTASNALILGNNVTIQAGTYTLSGGISEQLRIYVNYGSTWHDAKSNPITFTVDSSVVISSAIVLAGTETLNNVTFYPQLELGSTATEYEPYTGAAPSPSPDWEQPIEVVRGRNLYDESAAPYKQNYVLASNGNENQNDGYIITQPIAIIGGKSYTGSFIRRNPSDTDALRIGWYDANMTFISRPYFQNSGDSLTAPPSAAYARLSYMNAKFGTATLYDIQLTLGSTPQPYVPYGHVGMEVRLDTSVYADGYYINNEGVITYNEQMKISSFKCMGGIYHVVITTADTNATVRFFAYKNGEQTSLIINTGDIASNTVKTLTLDIPQGTDEVRISSHRTQTFQIYHTTPIPLPSRGWVGSLPDGTADMLTLDGAGKVEWTLPIEGEKFDGSENWTFATDNGFYLPKRGMKRLMNYQMSMYANNFIARDRYTMRNNGLDGISGYSPPEQFNPGNNWLYLNIQDISTVADFKAWLSTHNVTVLYPLATPVTEDCGYINPPSIEGDCQISIPELDALGVRYFVDDSAGTLARQWYERAQSEYETRLSTLESIVAGLV